MLGSFNPVPENCQPIHHSLNTQKKDHFVEVSFLLKNKEVVMKRFQRDVEINNIIPMAMDGLSLNPLEISKVGVEYVTVTRTKLQFSQNFLDSVLNKRITASIENILQ